MQSFTSTFSYILRLHSALLIQVSLSMRVIGLFENEHYYSLLRGNFNYAVAQIFQKLVNRSVTNFLRLSSTYICIELKIVIGVALHIGMIQRPQLSKLNIHLKYSWASCLNLHTYLKMFKLFQIGLYLFYAASIELKVFSVLFISSVH